MINPSDIKPVYHDETIAICREDRINWLLKECRRLRAEEGLKNIPDDELIISVLTCYKQKKERKLKRKALKNGME